MNAPLNIRHDIRIPSVPAGVNRLMELLADDEIPFSQLATGLEPYTAICARLIALANSAWASTSEPITTLDGACKHLGFNVVKSTAIALAVSSPFDAQKCPAFQSQRFWQDSLAVADTITTLCQKLDVQLNGDVQTYRTAALLHSLGLMLLVDQMPEQTHKALTQLSQPQRSSLSDLLTEHCGISYSDAAEQLFLAWQMPAELTNIIAHQNLPDVAGEHQQASQLLHLSKQLVSEYRHLNCNTDPQPLLKVTGVSLPTIDRIRQRLEPKMERIEKLASVLF